MRTSICANLWVPALIGVASLAGPVSAVTSGDNGVHDPSRMIESGGKVYVYGTGGGSKSSSDGLVWKNGPGMQPAGWPKWVTSWVPSEQGLWAPDGIYLNGQYLLFYSVCGPNYTGKPTAPCGVGVETTPTLDPTAANYKITDRGQVVTNTVLSITPFGAIDPAPFLDATGNLWVVWGGGFTSGGSSPSLWATRLNNLTGLPDTTDPGWKPPAHPGWPTGELGAKEGSFIQYHNGYYYLFWNQGGCCSGTSSTYTIYVARSASLTTPTFTSGNRIFYGPGTHATGGINGPGHMGIYQCGTQEYFTYHYYPTSGSILGVNTMTWGSDGWPVAGPQITKPLTLPCPTSDLITPAQQAPRQTLTQGDILTRKTATGFELYVPETGISISAEVVDLQGKKLGTLTATSGWNQIPGKMLVPGVNAIRVTSGGQNATALIFNNH